MWGVGCSCSPRSSLCITLTLTLTLTLTQAPNPNPDPDPTRAANPNLQPAQLALQPARARRTVLLSRVRRRRVRAKRGLLGVG